MFFIHFIEETEDWNRVNEGELLMFGGKDNLPRLEEAYFQLWAMYLSRSENKSLLHYFELLFEHKCESCFCMKKLP